MTCEQLRKESVGYYNAYAQVSEQIGEANEGDVGGSEVRDSQNLHNRHALSRRQASVTDSFGQIGYGGYGQQQQHQQNND